MTARNKIDEKLDSLKKILKETEKYRDAAAILETDMLTLCPDDAMEEQGEIQVFLENKEYLLKKSPEYEESLLYLKERRDELGEWDRSLVDSLYRKYLLENRISPEKASEFSRLEKKAYASWCKAKDKSDFSIFSEPLRGVVEGKKEECSLRSLTEDEEKSFGCTYDLLLDENERGFNVKKVDVLFNECRSSISGLIEKIRMSDKKIRTDFLSRAVSTEDHMKVARKLADVLGFDSRRGTVLLAKHGFTNRLSRNDVRMTTYPDDFNFTTNIYTTLHETGHALFEQLQPKENFDYFISDQKTQGMHESVSRFYENIIGRSEGFIHFIYPYLKELVPHALYDVSERELYEAVNLVRPSLIRVDADEVTYSLHIIIRYELEKELINGGLSVDELEEAWNAKYEEYLGLHPPNAREGVLQDVHWTSDFGYFPTYLLGNIYGAMIFNKIREEMNLDSMLREGKIQAVTEWMKDRVFLKADRLSPGEWIKDITGREIDTKDYLSYLNQKYSGIYG